MGDRRCSGRYPGGKAEKPEFYVLIKLVYPIFELYFSIIDKSRCLCRAGAFCLALLDLGGALKTVKKGAI
jgi:hypothetical protein